MDKNKLISDYQVRKATLGALGGDTTKDYKSVYEVDLAILEATEQGGGGGAKIDDETISAQTVWSSQKTKEEIDNAASGLSEPFYTETTLAFDQLGINEQNEDEYANIALAIYKYQSGLSPELQLFQNDNSAIIDIESLAFNTTDTATAYRNDGIYYDSDATGDLFIPITKLVNALDKTTADTYYNPINSVSASTSGYKFTKWNNKGQITGTTATAYQASQKVNGASRSLYSTSSTALPDIYAPTTAGTNGQYLRSNGSGAPTWAYISIDPHIIDDASAITGDYTPAIAAFYVECITKGYQANTYIKITSYDAEGTAAESFYLPSSSRIYNGNVELWLFTTEDGNTWENIHYIITGENITRNVTTGTFGA